MARKSLQIDILKDLRRKTELTLTINEAFGGALGNPPDIVKINRGLVDHMLAVVDTMIDILEVE